MTATLPTTPQAKSPSRRALLAGALGGLGALAASAIARVNPVRAGTDGDVVLGSALNSTSTATAITNTTAGAQAFAAYATGGGTGVSGQSDSYIGVNGSSSSSVGVVGSSGATNQPAIVGWSAGNSTGIQGHSGTSSPPAAKAKTGVYGYAAQDASSHGVTGESPAGIGMYGISSTGYGVYSAGVVYTTRFYELTEISTPVSPIANRARLFAKDNGLGKTQLCVKFANGTVKILATEG
jgi:hypothetical protein